MVITLNELYNASKMTGFTIYQQEKDYFQYMILAAIYSKPDKNIIFRGGTALQKAYGLNRFSEDLDFSINKKNDVNEYVEHVSEFINYNGFNNNIKKYKQWELSVRYKITIEGPLYQEKESSLCTVSLDFSKRFFNPRNINIIGINPKYPDIPQYYLVVADLKEILADKITALMKRESARDLFDICFILKKGVHIDINKVNIRLKYWKEKVKTKELKELIIKRKHKFEKIWNRELKSFLPYVPKFKDEWEILENNL